MPATLAPPPEAETETEVFGEGVELSDATRRETSRHRDGGGDHVPAAAEVAHARGDAPAAARPPVRIVAATELNVPAGIGDLDSFADWVTSGGLPDDFAGEVAWIDGTLEVDMNGGDIFDHESPKSEVGIVVGYRVRSLGIGATLQDGALYAVGGADLGCIPDVTVVLDASVESGRARVVHTKSGAARKVVGPPDIAVEVVSPSSPEKDTVELFAAYFTAGITEYWVVDARDGRSSLTIFTRGEGRHAAAAVDSDGFQRSDILKASYRLRRREAKASLATFSLDERPD